MLEPNGIASDAAVDRAVRAVHSARNMKASVNRPITIDLEGLLTKVRDVTVGELTAEINIKPAREWRHTDV